MEADIHPKRHTALQVKCH